MSDASPASEPELDEAIRHGVVFAQACLSVARAVTGRMAQGSMALISFDMGGEREAPSPNSNPDGEIAFDLLMDVWLRTAMDLPERLGPFLEEIRLVAHPVEFDGKQFQSFTDALVEEARSVSKLLGEMEESQYGKDFGTFGEAIDHYLDRSHRMLQLSQGIDAEFGLLAEWHQRLGKPQIAPDLPMQQKYQFLFHLVQASRFLKTDDIARRLGIIAKSVGKLAQSLRAEGLIENKRGIGYFPTDAGRERARDLAAMRKPQSD